MWFSRHLADDWVRILRCSAELARGTLDLLLPPVCACCLVALRPGSRQPALCDRCRGDLLDLPGLNGAFCRFCGSFVLAGCQAETKCPACRDGRFRFDQVVLLGRYSGTLREAVIRMKQFHEYPLAGAVGELLAHELTRQLDRQQPDVVLPIPKYWTKRLVSGTNSAELLAETVSRRLSVPVVQHGLQCRRNIRKQSLLTIGQRRKNVGGALRVSAGYDFSDAHVLIVDDIMTTGATAGEAARVLHRSGARRITVAVVGRAVAPPTGTGMSKRRIGSSAEGHL